MTIKWSKLFDWSVSDVQCSVTTNVADGSTYFVNVQYLHHGLRHVKFPVKRGATLAEHELVSKKAAAYFDKMCAKMHRDMKTW